MGRPWVEGPVLKETVSLEQRTVQASAEAETPKVNPEKEDRRVKDVFFFFLGFWNKVRGGLGREWKTRTHHRNSTP